MLVPTNALHHAATAVYYTIKKMLRMALYVSCLILSEERSDDIFFYL
jgi:hypothetical protein